MCAVWYAFGMGVLYIFLKVLTPGLIKQLTWGRSVPSGLCVFLGIVATMTKRKKSREQNTFDYTVLVRETTEASGSSPTIARIFWLRSLPKSTPFWSERYLDGLMGGVEHYVAGFDDDHAITSYKGILPHTCWS